MNAYNKLNGTYLCENKEMLTDVLRREWGFDGYVMTDWGAMNDRVEALKAGCNLEMPSCEGATDAEIVCRSYRTEHWMNLYWTSPVKNI